MPLYEHVHLKFLITKSFTPLIFLYYFLVNPYVLTSCNALYRFCRLTYKLKV